MSLPAGIEPVSKLVCRCHFRLLGLICYANGLPLICYPNDWFLICYPNGLSNLFCIELDGTWKRAFKDQSFSGVRPNRCMLFYRSN